MAMIFVFGSNLKGYHGAGAAFHAHVYYGAMSSCGEGPQGQCYAIPTKDRHLQSLSLDQIEKHVDNFIEYAKKHLEDHFVITPIGTGYAGYSNDDIKQLFLKAPHNCYFSKEWCK